MNEVENNIYQNHEFYDCFGNLLFRGKEEKGKWYIERGLAKFIGQENDINKYKLTFITKGPGHKGNSFELSYKKNICVVCGEKYGLTRHHVIPECYSRYYLNKKENRVRNIHDVLPLCSICHKKYEHYATQFKRKLAEEYNVPFEGIFKYPPKVTSYANTLIKYKDKIPFEKRKEMENIIINFLGKKDDLYKNIKLLSKVKRKPIKYYGELVVEKIKDFEDFNTRWRQHFLETMNPKYLSKFWKIRRK